MTSNRLPRIARLRPRRRLVAATRVALLALAVAAWGKDDARAADDTNDAAENEAMVHEAIDVIWNRGELDRIPEFYTEDFISHQPKEGFRWDSGHEGLRQLLTRTRAMFPDYHENLEDSVASGDRVVLRLKNTGTLAGDSAKGAPKTFEVTDFMLVRIEDGKIAEQWGLFDLYGMYVQLGVIEPPRLAPIRH